jgi:hypothetical protein
MLTGWRPRAASRFGAEGDGALPFDDTADLGDRLGVARLIEGEADFPLLYVPALAETRA